MIDILVLQIARLEEKVLCSGCKVSPWNLVHCFIGNYIYEYNFRAFHTVLPNIICKMLHHNFQFFMTKGILVFIWNYKRCFNKNKKSKIPNLHIHVEDDFQWAIKWIERWIIMTSKLISALSKHEGLTPVVHCMMFCIDHNKIYGLSQNNMI